MREMNYRDRRNIDMSKYQTCSLAPHATSCTMLASWLPETWEERLPRSRPVCVCRFLNACLCSLWKTQTKSALTQKLGKHSHWWHVGNSDWIILCKAASKWVHMGWACNADAIKCNPKQLPQVRPQAMQSMTSLESLSNSTIAHEHMFILFSFFVDTLLWQLFSGLSLRDHVLSTVQFGYESCWSSDTWRHHSPCHKKGAIKGVWMKIGFCSV